jgi:hypothetical protein
MGKMAMTLAAVFSIGTAAFANMNPTPAASIDAQRAVWPQLGAIQEQLIGGQPMRGIQSLLEEERIDRALHNLQAQSDDEKPSEIPGISEAEKKIILKIVEEWSDYRLKEWHDKKPHSAPRDYIFGPTWNKISLKTRKDLDKVLEQDFKKAIESHKIKPQSARN